MRRHSGALGREGAYELHLGPVVEQHAVGHQVRDGRALTATTCHDGFRFTMLDVGVMVARDVGEGAGERIASFEDLRPLRPLVTVRRLLSRDEQSVPAELACRRDESA